MRNLLLIILILALVITGWLIYSRTDKKSGSVLQALPASKHSITFNKATDSLLENYYQLSEAFVNWDSVKAGQLAGSFQQKLSSFQLDEIKDTSGVYQTAEAFLKNAEKDASQLQREAGITLQRRQFNSLTENIYQFLRTIRYDAANVYRNECPMAFNDEEAADWLSKKDSIRNPYMGLHHPRYKSGMIECGSLKETLLKQDSEKK
ncbi:MAG TPA: DUF3347 domain-containing protein [Flavisolibacter sp.]|nr:DUF3347 domain-containing protein [Flavisolibacter sp.]